MPDTLDSLGIDIGDLVPGLNDALGLGAGDDASDDKSVESAADSFLDETIDKTLTGEDSDDESVDEENDENISDEATQEVPDDDNEVEQPEQPDALGEALARLSAQENLNKSLQSELDVAQAKLSAPAFIPYDRLPENVQRIYDAKAEETGIDPRILVYDDYKDVLNEHRAEFNAKGHQRQALATNARAEVDKFFDDHPLRKKHGQAIQESFKTNEAWQKLGQLSQQNPEAFKVAGIALVDAAFRKAEADATLKQRTLKQQKTLRESTRSEASRAKPSSPTAHKPQPAQGDIDAKSMVEYWQKHSNPLAGMFK